MKRGELKRTDGPERKAPLKRGPGPKRKPPRALSAPERIKSESWHRGIGKTCAYCGNTYNADCDAHHIIRVQVLRHYAKRLGFDFDRVRWDTRNRLPLCRVCHERHHSRFRPIPLRILRAHAPKVFQFARELRLQHVINDEYPDKEKRRKHER